MKITVDYRSIEFQDGKATFEVDDNELRESLNCGKDDNTGSEHKSNKVELSNLRVGNEFKLGNETFIVLEHIDDSTKVISKEFTHYGMRFGDCNDWKDSYTRTDILNGGYYKKICNIVGEDNIIPMKRDLTSLDGLDDYYYCTDNISLLTATEYAKYHKVLGLKPRYADWWWLITPASTLSNGYIDEICYVESNGAVGWLECDCHCSVRPFFALHSNIEVEVTGNKKVG